MTTQMPTQTSATANGAMPARPAGRAAVTMNKNKKTTQILLIIAGAFGVCWMPYHLFMIGELRNKTSIAFAFEVLFYANELAFVYLAATELNNMLEPPPFPFLDSDTGGSGLDWPFIFCHCLAMTTTVTNPVLYGWLNTNLKHLFRAMIPYISKDRQQSHANAAISGASEPVVGVSTMRQQSLNRSLRRGCISLSRVNCNEVEEDERKSPMPMADITINFLSNDDHLDDVSRTVVLARLSGSEKVCTGRAICLLANLCP